MVTVFAARRFIARRRRRDASAQSVAAGAGKPTPPTPTFTKDVLPILQNSCQTCHHPGTPAPMSLMTFAEVRPWARSIKTRVSAARCRRGTSIAASANTSNDPSLSDKEIATIAAWVDGGAPEGRAADAPPALVFPASIGMDLRRA